MRWWQWLICAVLIVLGVMATVDLYRVYSAKSSIAGQVQYEGVKEVRVLDIDMTGIAFNKETLKYETTFHGVEFDGQMNGYEILVNDYPCSVVEYDAGYIYGKFVLDFYDEYGKFAVQSVVHIKFVFAVGRTRAELWTDNANGGLSYLYNYMIDSGLKIRVVYEELILV
jgi:hypothetical protein